jgi:hypothetical protein
MSIHGVSASSTDTVMLHAVATKRPARRQVSAFSGPSASDLSARAARGEYNIWHDKPTKRQQRAPAATRVNVALDSGTTAANDNPAAFICALFAKGCCHNGPECRFLHRIPFAKDMAKLSTAHDIFGRERHATNRADMSGVGTWSRDQRTLYVGKLSPRTSDGNLRRCFSEFGSIESTRVFAARGFAFITFVHRGSAEFAYMAMMDQPLGESQMINVRWAEDDKNPSVAKRKAADTASVVEHRVHQRRARALGSAPCPERDGAHLLDDDSALEARLNVLRGSGSAATTTHAAHTAATHNALELGGPASYMYPDTDDQYAVPAYGEGVRGGQQSAAGTTPVSGFNIAASVAAHLEAVSKDNTSSGNALAGLGGYGSSSDDDEEYK